jgi:hypothetical protein
MENEKINPFVIKSKNLTILEIIKRILVGIFIFPIRVLILCKKIIYNKTVVSISLAFISTRIILLGYKE